MKKRGTKKANCCKVIIETWMGQEWKELDVKRQEAERAGEGTTAAAYQQ